MASTIRCSVEAVLRGGAQRNRGFQRVAIKASNSDDHNASASEGAGKQEANDTAFPGEQSSEALQQAWELLGAARELVGGRGDPSAFYNADSAESAAFAAALEARQLARSLREKQNEIDRLKEAREALVEYAAEVKRSVTAAHASQEESLRAEVARLQNELEDARSQAQQLPDAQARIAELEQQQPPASDASSDTRDDVQELKARIRTLESQLAELDDANDVQQVEQNLLSALMEEKARVAELSSELERERKEKQEALEQAQNNAASAEIQRLTQRTRELEAQLAQSYSAQELNELRAQIIEEASKPDEQSQYEQAPATPSSDASASKQAGSISEATREGNGAAPSSSSKADVIPESSQSRSKPFIRNDSAQFKLRKRIFTATSRPTRANAAAVAGTSGNTRRRPFVRNDTSQFKLRRKEFPAPQRGSRMMSATANSVSTRRQPFRRGDTSTFRLKKRQFSNTSRSLAATAMSAGNAQVDDDGDTGGERSVIAESTKNDSNISGSGSATVIGGLVLASAASGGALLAASGMLPF